MSSVELGRGPEGVGLWCARYAPGATGVWLVWVFWAGFDCAAGQDGWPGVGWLVVARWVGMVVVGGFGMGQGVWIEGAYVGLVYRGSFGFGRRVGGRAGVVALGWW